MGQGVGNGSRAYSHSWDREHSLQIKLRECMADREEMRTYSARPIYSTVYVTKYHQFTIGFWGRFSEVFTVEQVSH